MIERRPKGLNAQQEQVYESLIKTIENYQFTDLLTLARLRHPDVFPYAKKDRLYRSVSEKIIQSWKDIGVFFHRLPDSYKKEIIGSIAFESLFTTQIFNTLEKEVLQKKRQKKRKSAEVTEQTLFNLYFSFFRTGYSGLIKMMPSEFTHYLISQTQPMLDLMQSISSYTEKINPKRTSLRKYGFKPSELGMPL